MGTKSDRQAAILEALSGAPIRTQGELRSRLAGRGIRCNQATLSRDIRELGLVKVRDPEGDARYAAAGSGPPPLSVVGRMIRGVEASGNLVVVKTDPGEASLLGITVDRLSWPDVAGTIAGDDTLLVVVRTRSSARKVIRRFESLRR